MAYKENVPGRSTSFGRGNVGQDIVDHTPENLNAKRKILYLHQYFRTPEMGGGTRSYEMARRLVNSGYDVTIITSDSGVKATARRTKIEGVKVHWIPVNYNNNMGNIRRITAFFIFSMKSLFASLRVPADLVFATSTPLTICLPALVVQRRRTIPFVFEVRDLWPEIPIAIGAISNPLLVRTARWLENLAYEKADRIVTLSPGMTEGVLKLGVSPSKVVEIPNSCDLDRFSSDNDEGNEIRGNYPWLKDAPMLLYAGTLGKINGVGWLARLAAEIHQIDEQIRIVVIGSGMEREIVRRLSEKLGVLDKNFFMFDSMSKTKIVNWFQASTVACSSFIPLEEMQANSANKFFDALAAGKPVAINYRGWQKRLIEQEDVGIAVPHDDLPKAAKELTELLRDENRCRRLGANARLLAEREFSRDMCANRLKTILDELLVQQ